MTSIESVRLGLDLELKKQFSSADEFTKYFLSLKDSLLSCCELKVYDDFLKIFDKYKNIVCSNLSLEPPCGYHNNAIFFQFRLSALLYQYFKDNSNNKQDLKQAIEDLNFWTSKVKDKSKFIEVNQKIIKLVQEVLEEKGIYFTIAFKLPYHLQLPDDNYILNFNNKEFVVSTEIFKCDDLVSYNKDRYFSKITLKVKGFTNCDNYWRGSSIDCQKNESSEILTYILEVMNYLIFHIKRFDSNSKVHILSPDDIGNITTNQYYANGEHYHFALAMQFSGLTMVDALSPTFLDGNINDLKKQIKNDELLLYEELYSISLINYQKEDYLSGFYIVNSAMESMIEWYLKSYCYMIDNIEFYNSVMIGKSSCSECVLYKKYYNELNSETPIKANIPSLFTQIKHILRKMQVQNSEIDKINQLVRTVKQDSIRNDLTHGRKKVINRIEIKTSLESFVELEKQLESIYQKILISLK